MLERTVSHRLHCQHPNGSTVVEIETGQSLLVGKSPDCDVVFDTPSASRQQFRLFECAGRLFLEDRCPRQVMLLNGEFIEFYSNNELFDNDNLWFAGVEAFVESHNQRTCVESNANAGVHAM